MKTPGIHLSQHTVLMTTQSMSQYIETRWSGTQPLILENLSFCFFTHSQRHLCSDDSLCLCLAPSHSNKTTVLHTANFTSVLITKTLSPSHSYKTSVLYTTTVTSFLMTQSLSESTGNPWSHIRPPIWKQHFSSVTCTGYRQLYLSCSGGYRSHPV